MATKIPEIRSGMSFQTNSGEAWTIQPANINQYNDKNPAKLVVAPVTGPNGEDGYIKVGPQNLKSIVYLEAAATMSVD